ncbi:MAG: hypothetical protein M3N98_10935, partial [Actinomycetota bacterium]|nr:hypothetical protein [Actinomycetota bacterium]
MDDQEPQRVEIDGMELHLDPADGADAGGHTALPPRAETWRRRSATGAILTGIALGLREALEPRRNEPAIVIQVSGDPLEDLPVEAHLDDVRPANSVVHIRPWLFAQGWDHPPADAPSAMANEAPPAGAAGIDRLGAAED